MAAFEYFRFPNYYSRIILDTPIILKIIPHYPRIPTPPSPPGCAAVLLCFFLTLASLLRRI